MPEKDAKDYADSIHAVFVESSAKNAININEVFIEISKFRPVPLYIPRLLWSGYTFSITIIIVSFCF